jgi:hypothetical protein
MRVSEPRLKLSYTDDEIVRNMVFSEDNMRDPSHQVDWWVTKAKAALPVLQDQVKELQAKLDSASANEKPEIAQRLESRKGLFQIYDALVAWGEQHKGGFMKTQDKLVLDLALNNPDRPIQFANTVSTSNFIGLEKYMIQEGMVYTMLRGDLNVKPDEIDLNKTRFMVDSVYKYRGVGDSTTYVNLENERLLSNYNTLYIRIALEYRTKIMRLTQQKMMLNSHKDSSTVLIDTTKGLAPELDQQIKDQLALGIKYCDLGIRQFPSEWRNYAVAAELLENTGNRPRAIEYLERGKRFVTGNAVQELDHRLEYFQTGKAE